MSQALPGRRTKQTTTPRFSSRARRSEKSPLALLVMNDGSNNPLYPPKQHMHADQLTALADQCLHPDGADMRLLNRGSGFDPKRRSAGSNYHTAASPRLAARQSVCCHRTFQTRTADGMALVTFTDVPVRLRLGQYPPPRGRGSFLPRSRPPSRPPAKSCHTLPSVRWTRLNLAAADIRAACSGRRPHRSA